MSTGIKNLIKQENMHIKFYRRQKKTKNCIAQCEVIFDSTYLICNITSDSVRSQRSINLTIYLAYLYAFLYSLSKF